MRVIDRSAGRTLARLNARGNRLTGDPGRCLGGRLGQMNDESSPATPNDGTSAMLIEALRREDGKNSTVRVYPDRIEWLKEKSISSLPRGRSDPPVIPLHTVASVKVRKDGPLFSKVLVRTERNTIVFRMYSPQAVEVRDAIAGLLAEPRPT